MAELFDGVDLSALFLDRPNITFAWDRNDSLFRSGEMNKLYFKAFCVNPPKDECFEPCPNTDVTGVGSQISTYITSIAFAIVIWYIPWMGRPMLYAHLSVIYSLMIAALVCILKTELTQNDGIFILVSVASPATLYMWYLTIISCWNPERFPIEKKNKGKSIEVHILRFVSMVSLAFEIALVCVMYVPSEAISFSQPACNKDFGMEMWFNIVWMLPFALQTTATVIVFFIAMCLCWLWTLRRGYKVPDLYKLTQPDEMDEKIYTRAPRVDLVTWTERILMDTYPDFMSPTLATCIVTVLQLLVVPSLILYPTPENIGGWLILAFGCFRERPRPGANPWKVYGLRIVFLLCMAVVVIASALFSPLPLPSIPDATIFFMACTVVVWSFRNFTSGNMRYFLPPLVIILVLGTMVTNVFLWVLGSPNAFAPPKTLEFPEGTPPEVIERVTDAQSLSFINHFMITMVTFSNWFILWCSTAFWAAKTYPSLRELIGGIFDRAHILKFSIVVAAPMIIWIQACNGSNPTDSFDLNFGQIFSLIVSFVTIVTLLDEAKQIKRPVWAAVFFSRR
ncbi:hypothetical protein FA15DRAFT_675841, partial [Coprinopsis marcescibilis]